MKLKELFEAGPYNIDWNRVARESLPLLMLAQDIKENGIKEPILLKDGKVADGIHRVFVLWLMGYKGDVPIKEVEL
jgi:ParB-like chromosome segregation protein Spo0J